MVWRLRLPSRVKTIGFFLVTILVVVVAGFGFIASHTAKAQATDEASHLITLYDRGVKSVFVTHAGTIGDALNEQGIDLRSHDAVEPGVDEELVAADYHVNIYRAKPVTVVDGSVRTKVMSAYQTPERIAKDADLTIYPEDEAEVALSSDLVSDGAGFVLTIHRAVTFTLDLYGRKAEVRTHEATVGAMLKDKGISLGVDDRISVLLSDPMTNGIEIRVWREGKQTITVDENIGYASEIVYDADRPVGYRQITTEGIYGVQSVTYAVEIQGGVEISRQEISRFTVSEPVKQILTIGIQGLENGLTRTKGAGYYTDSKGVSHRETYYDLDMGKVMRACGQGGNYSVRFDGMKIDSEGYILIAANYSLYPKCSIVETSAGPGRVYDTGGFVERYPTGFDLATDWSNNNGR